MCSLLWLLLHGVATADEAGPVCPSAVPVRVACFGDSLTAGDAKFDGYAKVQHGSRLGSDSVFSRGSYPRVLAGLLGPRFQVQAFAKSGMPMTELLPSACVVPGNDNASRVELVPHAAPSDYASATAAVARCHEALDLPPVLQAKAHGGDTRMAWRGDGRHPLLQAVVSSRPHIVLLLLGTNDAGELSYMNHIRPWYIATSTVNPQGMSLACYRQKSGTGHAHACAGRREPLRALREDRCAHGPCARGGGPDALGLPTLRLTLLRLALLRLALATGVRARPTSPYGGTVGRASAVLPHARVQLPP